MQEPAGHAPWLVGALLDLQADVAELAGAAMHPRIRDYFEAVGCAGVQDDAVAHCAAFVGAHLRWTGQAIPSLPLRARSYLRIGRSLGALVEPWPIGAVAVFRRAPSDPGPEELDALGHVGFLLGWTEGQVVLIGANQRWHGLDRVSIAPFHRNLLLDVRWPQPPREAQTR